MAAKFRNFYLSWLAEHRPEMQLADRGGEAPPEKLLQGVWAYQRLKRDKLVTTDGQSVRVLHPGFWNREPGPDFQKAIIQIGNEAPMSGDVEIDLVAAGWDQHAHARNPAYTGVILHVLWDEPAQPRKSPCLVLRPFLDSTLEELNFWLASENKGAPEGLAGQCSGPFRTLERSAVREVLRQAAEARLQKKAALIQASARQNGWEQALWEGVFSALGYKRNIWPMRRLAELRPLLVSGINAGRNGVLTLQARLYGAAGLLPGDTSGSGEAGKKYIRQLWDVWWREAEEFREFVLPRKIWNFAGIRPANHPERRLALAAHWLADGKLVEKLERWLEAKVEGPDLLESMEKILVTAEDPFWSYRWTMRSAPFRQPNPLVGPQRVTDLVMNVFLPWLWIRALSGRNARMQKAAEARYFNWPAGEDNSVLKLARQRLFGSSSKEYLKTAAEQQGMLQIVRDFCEYSNAACQHCEFPELLRAMVVVGEKS